MTLKSMFVLPDYNSRIKTETNVPQSGHEYTKSNVKFLVSVSNAPAIQKLAKFAEDNKNTQGVLTIGDEKAHNVFMMLNVRQDNDPRLCTLY